MDGSSDRAAGMLRVALAERALRCGLDCAVRSPGCTVRVHAAETAPEAALLAPGARLALTGWRLSMLGMPVETGGTYLLDLAPGRSAAAVRALADPLARPDLPWPAVVADMRPADRIAEAAVELCKIARLLPAAVLCEAGTAASDVVVEEAAVFAHRRFVAESLVPVVTVDVPLDLAPEARFVAFRPGDGGLEQYAVLVGDPARGDAPLCRLHSECFTGDLFGSLRCDCGQQLRGALARMREEGGGVLLYLRQEGRNIGLVNKLRAYRLQRAGLDTVDANLHLGFEPDARDFLAAATMLRRLGFSRVRLLTNNPAKVEALAGHGVEVVERVPHHFAANPHNRFYLETKARKSGHLIRLEAGDPPGRT